MASPPGVSTRETGRGFPGLAPRRAPRPPSTAIGDAIQDGGAPPPGQGRLRGRARLDYPRARCPQGIPPWARPEDAMAETVTWPDGARCTVMMTFDLDGES